MGQIVNYLGQVSTEVKGDKQRLVYIAIECLLSDFVLFGEQNIDYSMSDKNFTSGEWTVAALRSVECR